MVGDGCSLVYSRLTWYFTIERTSKREFNTSIRVYWQAQEMNLDLSLNEWMKWIESNWMTSVSALLSFYSGPWCPLAIGVPASVTSLLFHVRSHLISEANVVAVWSCWRRLSTPMLIDRVQTFWYRSLLCHTNPHQSACRVLLLDPSQSVHASLCHIPSPDHCYRANTVRFLPSGLMLVLPLQLWCSSTSS